MARTVQELTEAVLRYEFAPGKYTADIRRWLDDAQRMIFRRTKLRVGETAYAFTTVSGTEGYSTPPDFASIVFVNIVEASGQRKNSLDSVTDFKEFAENEITSGRPSFYIIDQGLLKLWPIPDAAYAMEMRYRKIPSSIVESASSSPTIAEDYYNLLEEYALAKCFARENDREESEFHMGLFEKGLVEFTGQMDHAYDDTPDQVTGSLEPEYWV